MADVDHELGAIRFIVDAPLSSKVAMFNNKVDQHQNSQFLNPFSQVDGRKSPKPTISREGYGKPIAGSLTEMRGQKAELHVWKEMYDLCRIIDDEGTPNPDEPGLKAITFGEIFNIYVHISDKCVGLLLRARKHGLLNFEGEMLFQRRDDDVPIYMMKPIQVIRGMLNEKQATITRSVSPAPQPTTVLMDAKSRSTSPAPNSTEKSLSTNSAPKSKSKSKSRSTSPAPESLLNSSDSTPKSKSKSRSTTPAAEISQPIEPTVTVEAI